MRSRQVAVAVLFLACTAVLAPAVGAVDGPVAQVDNNSTAPDNGSFGQQVSAFMQSSAVDANATTDSGMWLASVNRSRDRELAVRSRTDRLDRRLTRIETRLEQLEADRDSLPEVAYTARASALRERLASLREQINETDRTADRVGANVSGLDGLRRRAGNVSGPEIAAAARNITDAPRGPPAGVPGGPPENRPGRGEPPEDRPGNGPSNDGAGSGEAPTDGPGGGESTGDGSPRTGPQDGGPGDEGNRTGTAGDGNGTTPQDSPGTADPTPGDDGNGDAPSGTPGPVGRTIHGGLGLAGPPSVR